MLFFSLRITPISQLVSMLLSAISPITAIKTLVTPASAK